MKLSKHFEEIDTVGFTTIKGVVTAQEVDGLRRQLKLALAEDWAEFAGKPGKQEHLVQELVTRGSVFLELLENEVMYRVFSHFLGESFILYAYNSTVLKPHEQPPSSFIHMDSPRFIPNYYSALLMTLALDDFTAENGATLYLPGSHKSEEPPSEERFYSNATIATRKAGDAVFWNPRLYHAGGVNRTNKTRYALTVYACRSFMRQRFDYPRLVDPDLMSKLSPRVQGLLGMNVRVPVNQHEYYVRPEERLYKPNQS